MWSYATLNFHIKPKLAGALATCLYKGLDPLQGADNPQQVSNMLWSLAILGYKVPPEMLWAFKSSLENTTQTIAPQNLGMAGWALAVYGAMDLRFVEKMVSLCQEVNDVLVSCVEAHAMPYNRRCVTCSA